MKLKNFLTATFFMLVLSTAFANDGPVVGRRTMETFIKEFYGATDVRWTGSEGFQQARFTFLDQVIIAYFSDDGKLIGTARNILFQALPLPVIQSFQRQFPDGYSIWVHEVVNEEGIMYWLKLEARGKAYHIKSDAQGNFLKIEAIKKTSASNVSSKHR